MRVFRIILMSAAVLSAALLSCCAPDKQPRQVILITMDTTRADHLGCYGNREVRTPSIDRLAGDGILFRNCYSVVNFTNPSHASIMTSLYTKDHGVTDNHEVLPATGNYLAEVMKKAGFRTAAFVSVNHLGPMFGFGQGFDEFHDNGTEGHKGTLTAGERNVALFEWLKQNSESDFFVWVHYFDPHTPYTPPPPYDRMYTGTSGESLSDPAVRERISSLTPWMLGQLKASDDPEYYRNMYKGEISYLDEQLGRLFDLTRELGIYNGATIILTADHGESLGEHGVYFEHNFSLHDQTVHVPLIIKASACDPGARDTLSSTIDIYPTLLSLYGIGQPSGIRGRDLGPALTGNGAGYKRDVVYSENAARAAVAVRDDRYTFIRNLLNSRGPLPDTEENRFLYDDTEDPGQTVDIARNNPELEGSFRALAAEFLEDVRESEKPAAVTDPDAVEKLKALGYVQ